MPLSIRFWRLWLEAIGVILILAFAGILTVERRAWRRDQAELAATITATKKAVDAADARERRRAAELRNTLAQVAARKRAVLTPRQVLSELPNELPLPSPIMPLPAPGSSEKANPDQPAWAGQPSQPSAVIPAEDLKPLYDFVLDCKACQARLAAAQGDISDERAKNAAVTRERDAALKAAKGGSFWRRVRNAGKWLLIGAAAGAALAAAH